MAVSNGIEPSVDYTDELHFAVGMAEKRMEACPVGPNLIDSVSMKDWVSWDASSEIVMVSDDNDLDNDDENLPMAA